MLSSTGSRASEGPVEEEDPNRLSIAEVEEDELEDELLRQL